MKKLLLGLLSVISVPLWAQKPTFTEAKVKQATVYFRGVELTHTASAMIPKGTSELVIKNVANNLSEETIRVLAPSNVTVLSAQFTNRYLNEYELDKESPMVKRVQDSLELLGGQLKKIQNQRESEEKTIRLLDDNRVIGGEQTGVNFADLSKIVDYYATKRTDLLNSVDLLRKKEDVLKKTIDKLTARIEVSTAEKEKISDGKIILQLMSPVAQKADFSVSYISNSATWHPFYELRSEKLSDPIQLLYKAQISQTTGLDWKAIRLSLSSGNPNFNNQFPILQSWHIYLGELGELSTRTRNYAFEARADNRAPMPQNKMILADAKLEESTLSQYTTSSENQLNVSFDIDVPYDILANGKAHSVSLQELHLKADYKYYTAPRVDKEVYLVASVEDYSKYNLLAGEANIVFEGLYVGKTYIDPNQTSETLNLTMGNDKKISVKREKVVEKSQTKFISGSKEQIFTYDITLRNNKKEKIDLVLKDQYPVGTEKSIEIELLEASKASVDEQTHILTWDISLKPNETKTFRISYKLKYPKDKVIENF